MIPVDGLADKLGRVAENLAGLTARLDALTDALEDRSEREDDHRRETDQRLRAIEIGLARMRAVGALAGAAFTALATWLGQGHRG